MKKPIRAWLVPGFVTLVVATLLIWGGIALVTVDDGSKLSASSHKIRERVITEKVDVYQKDDVDFLRYLGEEYPLPSNKSIFVGETIEELKGLSRKKITKSIEFDDNEQEYVYKEEVFVYSYVVAKSKKSMEIRSAICFLFGIFVFICALVSIPASFLICSALLEE